MNEATDERNMFDSSRTLKTCLDVQNCFWVPQDAPLEHGYHQHTS